MEGLQGISLSWYLQLRIQAVWEPPLPPSGMKFTINVKLLSPTKNRAGLLAPPRPGTHDPMTAMGLASLGLNHATLPLVFQADI